MEDAIPIIIHRIKYLNSPWSRNGKLKFISTDVIAVPKKKKLIYFLSSPILLMPNKETELQDFYVMDYSEIFYFLCLE